MITDHPYRDNNGPTYAFGICDHSTCGRRPVAGHACPRRYCGKGRSEHSTMLWAEYRRRARVLSVARWEAS